MDYTTEEIREVAYRRAGGTASEPTYDPELLDVLCQSADELDRLRAENEQLKSYIIERDGAAAGDVSTEDWDALDAYCLADGHRHRTREEEAICSLVYQRSSLRAENERLRGLLRRVEWENNLYAVGEPSCPVCNEARSDGHASDCELARELNG